MSSSITTLIHFQTRNYSAWEMVRPPFFIPSVAPTRTPRLLERLNFIALYSHEEEPGVLRYAMCIPHADEDGAMKFPPGADEETSIFAIEEDENQAALDAHMGSEMTQTLLYDLDEEKHHKHLHQNTVATHELHTLPPSISYTRPITSKCKDLFIVLVSCIFQPGQVAAALLDFKGS